MGLDGLYQQDSGFPRCVFIYEQVLHVGMKQSAQSEEMIHSREDVPLVPPVHGLRTGQPKAGLNIPNGVAVLLRLRFQVASGSNLIWILRIPRRLRI